MALVALSMDDRADAASMAALVQATYPVVPDPKGDVARRYGVYNLLGDGVSAPATFLVAKDGTVLWAYVGRDAGDRPAASLVVQQVDALVR